MYQSEIALHPGDQRLIGEEGMRPVPLAQVVRKGGTVTALASGPTVAGMVHGPLAAGFSPMMGAQIGWVFELPRLSLIPRVTLGYGRALSPAPDVASNTFREVSAELAAAYVIDLGRLAVAPTISAGWGFFAQSLDRGSACASAPCTLDSHPQGLITTVGGWAAWPLGRGFSLEASLELANFYLRRQGETTKLDEDAPRTGTLTYRAGLGVGYRY
jgi:hypothetical protein